MTQQENHNQLKYIMLDILKTKVQVSKKSLSKNKKKKEKTNIENQNQWFEDYINVKQEAPLNSIKGFLNECHWDIRNFIERNGVKSIKQSCEGLDILTKNNFLVKIKDFNQQQKGVKIIDNNTKTVIVNTKAHLFRQVKASIHATRSIILNADIN